MFDFFFVFQNSTFHFNKLSEILDPADMDFCINFDSYRKGITVWINYLREENVNVRLVNDYSEMDIF